MIAKVLLDTIYDSQDTVRHYMYMIAKVLTDTVYDSQGIDRLYI
jgi:hypothetical protein